ncbi:hypothetical protein [Muricoccus vinaceus]|uniref:Uncharacterized protein n=1 Tax=Muricoccus vinaceus TaxID=424704 RepID=A0ABV6IXJ5_9PROT
MPDAAGGGDAAVFRVRGRQAERGVRQVMAEQGSVGCRGTHHAVPAQQEHVAAEVQQLVELRHPVGIERADHDAREAAIRREELARELHRPALGNPAQHGTADVEDVGGIIDMDPEVQAVRKIERAVRRAQVRLTQLARGVDQGELRHHAVVVAVAAGDEVQGEALGVPAEGLPREAQALVDGLDGAGDALLGGAGDVGGRHPRAVLDRAAFLHQPDADGAPQDRQDRQNERGLEA